MLPQHMGNPSVKGWLMVKSFGHCIFCGLNRVRFLEVSKALPGCGTILPLAARLPTNGTASQVCKPNWTDNLLVLGSNCRVKSFMVNNRVKGNVLIPVGVTLHIHCLSNQVCAHHSLITIVKCKRLLMRVKDGVSISPSDRVTIFIPFPGSNTAL